LYPAMVLMGFMLIASVVFSLFPFLGWPLMTVGMAMQAGVQINMGGWMITVALTLIVVCVGWMLVMMITPGCKVDKLASIDITQYQKEMAPLTKMQKAALFITIAQVVGCIALTFLSGTTGWRKVVADIGVYGWLLICVAVSMVWHIDGQPVLNKKTAPAYFYWDLILVVASAMVVANQITSAEAGISPMIGQLMAPLFGLPSYAFLLALGFVTFFLTNFANNVAVTITMMTIAMTMASQFNFNLQVALMVITVYGVIGLLTPAGSVNGAMIHAHDMTSTKSAYIAGIIMMVFMTAVMALVLIPLGLKFM
ncbi:MAG: anion permease, partial [Peptococcaceae bacterium]|nr:anion permease [Peptococcaceae bacterium]